MAELTQEEKEKIQDECNSYYLYPCHYEVIEEVLNNRLALERKRILEGIDKIEAELDSALSQNDIIRLIKKVVDL